MNFKAWLPLLAAPVIGVALGVALFRTSDAPASASPPPAGARPAGGAAWMGELLPGMGSGAAVSAARAEFEAALRLPLGNARSVALERSFTRWMLAAPAEASAHVASIPLEERRSIVSAALVALAQDGADLAAVIDALAAQDPALALDFIQRHPELDARGVLTSAILPGLIDKDITLAAGTVAAMKERAPVALIQQVAAAYGRHDPQRAYEWAGQMIERHADLPPSRVLDEVSGSLAARDPLAAVEFMERTGDAAVRKSLMSELAIRQGQDDLAGAWTWLGRYGADPAYAEVAQNLLYRWSYTQPQEVARILPTVRDAQVQATATAHLTQFWQRRDAAAYERWVASLPPGQLKTAALAAR